eukprot:TRINITY_DN80216_c0_g1_i1.p1 TRINITY_DN80216_c0_g1~~TRINITY_DN80216_c0_g1_i1.p1  ORF type:complete len:769 (-),score=190.58 TRINITY_DN80216_c0_g1_i1:61-2367(-)
MGGCLSSSQSASAQPLEIKEGVAPKGKKLLDDYDLGRVLGEGAFGVVYLCTKKGTSDTFAVKMIDKVETPLESIKAEADMLLKLKHPRVVALHSVYFEKVFVCMVMDCYSGGDMIEGMRSHWQAKGMIPQEKLKNILKQMVEGIAWIHSQSVVHRDVKGDNYLMDRKDIVDPECKIFLSDFGTVIEVKPGERLKEKCGTKIYWSPEFFAFSYSFKVDIWAIGVVLFGLLSGKFPFKDENDVHNKRIKVGHNTKKELSDLIYKMLERKEADRLDGKGVLASPWLASEVAKDASSDPEPMDVNFKPELGERGPKKDIGDRRRELVARLQARNEKTTRRGLTAISPPLADKEKQDEFVVEDTRNGHKTLMQWWSKDKVDSHKLIKLDGSAPATDELSGGSLEAIKQLLEDHTIDTSKFGQNGKTLEEFVKEVQCGETRLMLDAAEHRTLVRVLDLVLLRLVCVDGKQKKFLVRTKEETKGGQIRESRTQLEGTKRVPHENSIETAARVVRDRLHLVDVEVEFDAKNIETFEEQEESHSYPGVRTVYRKSIVEARVPEGTDLSKLGIADNKGLVTTDGKGVRRDYAWLTEAEASSKQVKLRAPHEEQEISALVDPPVGLNEEELINLLQKGGVELSKFGTNGAKTLEEFANELSSGECGIELQKDNTVTRVVDVVALTVIRPRDGSSLIEAKQMYGDKKDLNRLPAVKRRSDENMFLAAQRCLMKGLGMDINEVTMKRDEVVMVTEAKESPSYPGIKTLYRKRIIPCVLVSP